MMELTKLIAAVERGFLRIRHSEEGQTLVEYALIIAVVSIGVLAGMQLLTGALNGIFGAIASFLNNKVPLPS